MLSDQGRSPTTAPLRNRTGSTSALVLWTIGLIVYSLVAFVSHQSAFAQALYPEWLLKVRPTVIAYIQEWITEFGWSQRRELVLGVYFFITAGLIPFFALLVANRWRPRDWGLRMPNRVGWRVLIVGWLIALPALVWLSRQSQFTEAYRRWLGDAGWSLAVSYYLSVFVVEHFFFHGALLALGRRDRRWPDAAPVITTPGALWNRALQWIGIAQPIGNVRGGATVLRWLGLPVGCWWPVLLSGVLFWVAHFGKHPGEALLSLPGGVASAFVAYRTNSLLVPFGLHVGCALMVSVLLYL